MKAVGNSSEAISIVIPAHNEADSIPTTLSQLATVLRRIARPTEIIVVDDGSEDRTAELAEQAGARVVRHPINSGYGRAIISGVEVARYNNIAIVDADGTYPLELLPELLQFYDKGFDMVVGARQGPHFHPTISKRLLRSLFRLLSEFTTGRSIPDINSGYRIFRKQPVLQYQTALSPGFSFTTSITLLFMLNGRFVGYFPIPYQERVGKSKVNLLRDGLRSLQIIVTIIAQFNSMKLFLPLLLVTGLGTLFIAAMAVNAVAFPTVTWVILAAGWLTMAGIAGLSLLGLAVHRSVPPGISGRGSTGS